MSNSLLDGIKNAKITGTSITRNHGCLTIWIHLDYGGGGQSFGGYALNQAVPDGSGERVPGDLCGKWITGILEVFEVDQWEDLPGTHCRADATHNGISRIGHILKDQWFVAKSATVTKGEA